MEDSNYFPSINYSQKIIEDISELFSRAGVYLQRFEAINYPKIGTVYELYVDKYLSERDFNEIYSFLINKYKYFPVQIQSNQPVIRLIPVLEEKKRNLIKITLLLATVSTVLLTGMGLTESFYSVLNVNNYSLIITWSIVYTTVFLLALGLHEISHLKTSRRDNIVVDGPFFIPAPPIQLGFIGTLGAVITMKSLPPSRESLAKLGLSGPLMSFIIGLLIGVAGIYLSPKVPLSTAGELEEITFLPLSLYILLIFVKISEGYVLLAHPLLIASFIILLVTFLNLLPIGQLDGGHIVRSYVSQEIYEKISYVVIASTFTVSIVLGLFNKPAYAYYLSLTIIMSIFKVIFSKKPHPGSANQLSRIRDYRYLAVYLLLIMLTIPIPI